MSGQNTNRNHSKTGITSTDWLTSTVQKYTTRRKFLKGMGVGGLGIVAMCLVGCGPKSAAGEELREINIDDALGMVIGLPNRCVGCRRCELACTEYNEGFSQPTLARINIRRNFNFGPKGAQLGFWRGEGRFGNHRVIQETCRQCPHPVPCALACPYNAIEVVPPANARVVNPDKCEGCKTCQRACPWGMMTFDEEAETATKCHTCNNDPECVRACPAGALRYIPWQDKTKDIPARFSIPAAIQIPDDIKCETPDCHPDFEGSDNLADSLQ
ncbi:MAG: 4Fe-4S dicluster domain-containing protein [Dehalococcoidia bacterium]|nr:MAG: 4Fe-4S dicluster domain-containing protein [Dehalococcoidia bacterium]